MAENPYKCYIFKDFQGFKKNYNFALVRKTLNHIETLINPNKISGTIKNLPHFLPQPENNLTNIILFCILAK